MYDRKMEFSQVAIHQSRYKTGEKSEKAATLAHFACRLIPDMVER
jgi:hypothetical protein